MVRFCENADETDIVKNKKSHNQLQCYFSMKIFTLSLVYGIFLKFFSSEFYRLCFRSVFEICLIKRSCCFVLELLSLKFSVALVSDSVKYEDEED
jgi:hypothetical protein